MLRILAIAFLVCVCVSLCHAQDSIQKKATPVKLAAKPKIYAYHATTPDSAGRKPAFKYVPGARLDTLADKSLRGQYQFLLTKVYHYQQPLLAGLWKSVTDTLKFTNRQLRAAAAKINSQAKIIDSLKANQNDKDQQAANARGEVSVLGINMPLSGYNVLVWGLIAILAITAFVVISQSARFRSEATYRTKLYSELEEDFKSFRSKANDKEKKLARELQTERNKLDDLLGRG